MNTSSRLATIGALLGLTSAIIQAPPRVEEMPPIKLTPSENRYLTPISRPSSKHQNGKKMDKKHRRHIGKLSRKERQKQFRLAA